MPDSRESVFRAAMGRREFVSLAVAGACGALLAGCSQPSQGSADAAGGASGSDGAATGSGASGSGDAQAYDASVVVALSRSVADMWLCAGGTLAGATDDAISDLGLSDATSVGTIFKPSKEAIVGLGPTLVLLSEDVAVQKQLADELRAAGVGVIDETIDSFEDYESAERTLCDITGRDDLYDENVTQVAAHVEQVRASVQAGDASREDRTYLALRVSATKNKALKRDNFACEIFDDMALANVADDDSALDELSLEAIVDADPSYVFVITQGDEGQAEQAYQDAFASQAVWQDLTAAREGRVHRMPTDLFHYKPNERWGEAYDYAYQLVYG
jgi:iron complex transport system substrate-binding protein